VLHQGKQRKAEAVLKSREDDDLTKEENSQAESCGGGWPGYIEVVSDGNQGKARGADIDDAIGVRRAKSGDWVRDVDRRDGADGPDSARGEEMGRIRMTLFTPTELTEEAHQWTSRCICKQ
jgi:hypothetical protein